MPGVEAGSQASGACLGSACNVSMFCLFVGYSLLLCTWNAAIVFRAAWISLWVAIQMCAICGPQRSREWVRAGGHMA